MIAMEAIRARQVVRITLQALHLVGHIYIKELVVEYKQNLHTHTTYCDGKDTPEEMILRAIE